MVVDEADARKRQLQEQVNATLGTRLRTHATTMEVAVFV